MKPIEDDKWLDDILSKVIGSEKSEPDFEKWRQSHPEAVEMLTSRAYRQSANSIRPLNIWRVIMKSKITKLAAAAAIIIAAFIGIYQFGGSINVAGVAWADLAERVEQIRTCVFRGHSTVTGGPKGAGAQEMEMFVSSEYGFRADMYHDGKLQMSQFMLPAEKAIISIMPEQKKYMRMLLTDEHVARMRQQGSGDPRDMVRQFMSTEYTELGRDVIDGVEVEGIETTDPKALGGVFENYVGRLWVDVRTDLPVRMEMEIQMPAPAGDEPMKMSMVMDGFEWGVEIDPSVFEPDIPDDYTLMAEVQMPNQDEQSAIRGLRLFAELADGKYPSSMSVMEVVRQTASLTTPGLKKENVPGEPNGIRPSEVSDEMMKELMEKTMTITGTCMFYTELIKEDKDAAYYGDKVAVDNPDAVLMRWKISDDEYRVIFGDLTTENATPERLAELEKSVTE